MKQLLKITLMTTAIVIFVGNNKPQQTSRTIASLVSSEECQQRDRLASLQEESDQLEKQLSNLNQLMIGATTQQNGLQFHVITESAYSKWSRENPGYSQQSIDRYHQQVMLQRKHFAQKMQASWSPAFDSSGNIVNTLYGHGPHTFSNITHMYAQPQSPLPALDQSHLYTDFSELSSHPFSL